MERAKRWKQLTGRICPSSDSEKFGVCRTCAWKSLKIRLRISVRLRMRIRVNRSHRCSRQHTAYCADQAVRGYNTRHLHDYGGLRGTVIIYGTGGVEADDTRRLRWRHGYNGHRKVRRFEKSEHTRNAICSNMRSMVPGINTEIVPFRLRVV